MEIACAFPSHLFPKDQRYKTKDGECRFTDFSDFSLLPQSLSRAGRDHKERRDVMAAPNKRKHSGEENPPEKKQKKTIEALKSMPKVITKPAGNKIGEKQNLGFQDLIAKAREKLHEKRQIDHRNTYIARQRLTARLALNQVIATADFDDHISHGVTRAWVRFHSRSSQLLEHVQFVVKK